MKSRRIVIMLTTLAVASLVARSFAAETKKAAMKAAAEPAPEWAELFGGAPLPVVWQSISAASEKIDAALAANKLDGISAWAETIHLGAHALDDQITLEDPERAKRLRAAFVQAAKIADDVMKAVDRKQIDHVADAQRRLKSALALAKLRMPKPILDAPKQELRFAKAATVEQDSARPPNVKK